MRAPDDARQVSRDRRCLLPAELLDLDLEVLRHQLAHGDAFVEQPAGHHPLAQVRRKRAPPATTRSALSRGIFASGARGAAARTPSLMSMRQRLFELGSPSATPTSTAYRRRPSELQPFIE